MVAAGQDVFVRHRHGMEFELLTDALFRAAPLTNVTVDSALEADMVRRIDIDRKMISGCRSG